MRTGRISAVAAAVVVAVGALVGAVGAGPASAASYTHLCIDDLGEYPYCADSNAGLGVIVNADTSAAIRQADNVNYCMQLDQIIPGTYQQLRHAARTSEDSATPVR